MQEQQNGCSGHPTPSEAQRKANMAAIKNKILVLSGKGGVGKSTVAANLAAELARNGFKVGLLDTDLHGPSLARMTGQIGQKTHAMENQILPLRIGENLVVMSIPFLLGGRDEAMIWRGPMKYSVINQLLTETLWGELDYLVIDAPPGTGDEPLSVAQLVGANAHALVVTTPQQVAIEDVRRCITFCRQVHLNILGLVENMAGMLCPHCNGHIDIFPNEDAPAKELARAAGIELLASLPVDPAIARGADAGEMIYESGAGKQTQNLWQNLVEAVAQKIHAKTADTADTKGNDIMIKIAIPTAQGKLCAHFGHCEAFTLIDAKPEEKVIVSTSSQTPPPHEPGVLPKWLGEQGVNVIIAGGMGQRAQSLFEQNNIKVVVGASPDTPENLVLSYMDDKLETGQNLCDH